eukprot:1192491-Prorocentrum_minimum.AAC.7
MSRVCFSELPSTSPVKSDGFLRSTSPGKVVPARAHGLSGNPARERSRRPAAGRGARGARAPTVGVPRLFNGAAVFSKTRVFRRRAYVWRRARATTFGQQPELREQLRVNPGDGGLARARVAEEHPVEHHLLQRLLPLLAVRVAHHELNQLPHGLLHRGQPLQALQPLVGGAALEVVRGDAWPQQVLAREEVDVGALAPRVSLRLDASPLPVAHQIEEDADRPRVAKAGLGGGGKPARAHRPSGNRPSGGGGARAPTVREPRRGTTVSVRVAKNDRGCLNRPSAVLVMKHHDALILRCVFVPDMRDAHDVPSVHGGVQIHESGFKFDATRLRSVLHLSALPPKPPHRDARMLLVLAAERLRAVLFHQRHLASRVMRLLLAGDAADPGGAVVSPPVPCRCHERIPSTSDGSSRVWAISAGIVVLVMPCHSVCRPLVTEPVGCTLAPSWVVTSIIPIRVAARLGC